MCFIDLNNKILSFQVHMGLKISTIAKNPITYNQLDEVMQSLSIIFNCFTPTTPLFSSPLFSRVSLVYIYNRRINHIILWVKYIRLFLLLIRANNRRIIEELMSLTSWNTADTAKKSNQSINHKCQRRC